MKTSLFVEYQDLQVNEKDIVAKVKDCLLYTSDAADD